jgi:putative ABC transport system ATP-binding protein
MSSPASQYELIPTANGAASDAANHKPAATGKLMETGNGHRNDGALIRLDQVVKAYQTPAGEFLALRGIDLAIGRGEFVAVVGKSGSGKSTLINMITGIDRPTRGEIYIDNTAIHKLAEGPMAEWRGRNVGVIFQFFQLLPMLTVIENVMLPMDFCNMFKSSEREKRALHLLEQVDMADQAYKLPSEVSGGQQQRAAIARALANDPPLLVADEPTGNLDSKTADQVFHLFEQMVNQGKTILMVTHDEDLAHQVRRMITIADGQIVGQEYFDRNAAALTEGTNGAGADEPSAAPPSEPALTPQETPV